MNSTPQSSGTDPLGKLLREARITPSLPGGFGAGVWRRIERTEVSGSAGPGWLNTLATWLLQPRFALATGLALVLAGALFGTLAGEAQARQVAQARYLAAVAMSVAP